MHKLDWIILAICALLAWPTPALGEPFISRIESKFAELSRKRSIALAALGAFAILLRLSLLAWMPTPQPKIHDELSYLLEADTFAHGRLTNPPHPLAVFFDTFHVIQHPTYASMYPPAQGAVLALGKLLGQPWIGVLLSTAAMCMAITWMLEAWVTPPWALLGGILVLFRIGIFSYWMNSYWGGSVAALGAALVLGAWPRLLRSLRNRDAAILGLGIAILATSRPLEGLIFCFPVAASIAWWLLRQAPRTKTAQLRSSFLTLGSILICALGFIAYNNWRVTHDPRVFPYSVEQKSYSTSPVFVWQAALPRLTYTNAQFDDFYNRWLPTLYQTGWPGFRRVTREKFWECWMFFLGPALTIPLLLFPWVLGDRRARVLLAQFALCWGGLLAVAWFHPHYAAPLMATTMILLILGLRELWRWQYRGHPIGAGIARLIVLFTILLGPVYLLVTRSPTLSEFLTFAPEGLPPRYVIGLALTVLVIFLVRLRSKATVPPANIRAAKLAVLEFLLMVLAITQICVAERTLYPGHYPFDNPWTASPRVAIEEHFKSIPGPQLLLIKYASNHNVHDEVVYNDADIDHAKLVWARDIPGQDMDPLLRYFRNRKVWIVEPDAKPFLLYPYLSGGH